MTKTSLKAAVVLLALASALPSRAQPDLITSLDVMAIPQQTTRSGNGSLNLRLFTFSGSEVDNRSGLFNGDNANNSLPNSGGADTQSFYESYITTAGKLKSYYNLNFAPGSVDSIMLFLDLNETGQEGQLFSSLLKVDIWLNPVVEGNPNPVTTDISSATQAGIKNNFSGGTLLATLDSDSFNLPVNSQGAGWADYAINTTVNPFALQDTDVLLFHVGMGRLNNGAEDIFLSGSYSPMDVSVAVPEPSIAHLALLALVPWLARRFRAPARPIGHPEA